MSESTLPSAADAVVIGGGCIGASILYQLTEAGLRNVVLIDRGPLASGPTGRSGSQLIPRSEHPVIAAMKWEGLQFYRNFAERTGRSVDFVPSGYIAISPEAEAEALSADLEHLSRFGSDAAMVDAKDLGHIFPGLKLDGEAALWIPEAGYTDPVASTQAMAQCAAEGGAQIFCFQKVTGIKTANGRVSGVATAGGEISTQNVIVASGVWSNELLKPLGESLPLYWHRVEVGSYRRPPTIGDHPIVGDFTHRFYFRPDYGDLTFTGSIPRMTSGVTAPPNLNNIDHPDRYSETISEETIRSLHARLQARIPAMSSSYWRRGHTCIYDVTPDWHPVIHQSQKVVGLFVAAGFSGHGFVMSPAVGRLVAGAVTGKADAERLSVLRASRFADNQPVHYKIA